MNPTAPISALSALEPLNAYASDACIGAAKLVVALASPLPPVGTMIGTVVGAVMTM